jgi:hypothetical protein
MTQWIIPENLTIAFIFRRDDDGEEEETKEFTVLIVKAGHRDRFYGD